MNEPTLDTLTRRLDRLEQENRRMKRGALLALAAAVAAVALMGQTAGRSRVVEAEQFILTDAKGH